MIAKRIPRPRDPLALAKLIGDIATGQVADTIEDGRNSRATESGRQGGTARARGMTPEERSEAAALAAQARWKKSGH